MSEPFSSDLNVNFVCLSVCLSVMDGPSTYRKSLSDLILRVLRHALIQKPLESGQSDTSMTETTHGLKLTYSVA